MIISLTMMRKMTVLFLERLLTPVNFVSKVKVVQFLSGFLARMFKYFLWLN